MATAGVGGGGIPYDCQQCGAWTVKVIDHDDARWCPRCVPSSYGCPF